MTHVLGIETSCDETGVAIVRDGCEIVVNDVASQIDLHAEFGGVVPEIASRQHVRIIYEMTERAIRRAGVPIDVVAATNGPGLMGSLLVGVSFAKAFAYARKLPFVPVHHIEGHLFSPFLQGEAPTFPYLALVVSGGHTMLVHCKAAHDYVILGTTRDDAVGESFDKIARMLSLPYPGGPSVQREAESGNPDAFDFPRAMQDATDLGFSYSGLKTAVLYTLQRQPDAPPEDVAASFQAAAVDMLVRKTKAAVSDTRVPLVVLVGGVAANRLLRERLTAELDVPVLMPPIALCTDNAAMIAAAGYWAYAHDKIGSLRTTPDPNLPLT